MKLKHVIWNLTGLGIPLVIAALAIPYLLNNIGNERFGLLALAWGLVGYAGILDLGIGRALTRLIARRLGTHDHHDIPDILFTATRLTYKICFVGTLILCLAAITGATFFIKAESISKSDLLLSAFIFSLAIPMQSISATYKGVNEAYLNFKAISIIRIALGASNFGLPMVVSIYTKNLPILISTLVVSRLCALVFYRLNAHKCIKKIKIKPNVVYKISIQKEILKFGGWFSVSNIINPIIGSLDRVLISILVSSAAVTTYAIPQEITTQTLIIVGALTTVTFPYLSSLISTDAKKASTYFAKLTIGITLVFVTISTILFIWGPIILNVWIGENLDDASTQVMRILAIGLVPYTIGTMMISKIHAYGRTDATAKIHLAEAIPFIFLTYYLIQNFGVTGAAIAWTTRVSADAVILTIINKKINTNKSICYE